MINVLVSGLTENPGGMESVIINYYRNIDKTNIHFDFLCKCAKPAYYDEIVKNGSKIITISKRIHVFKYYRKLFKIFKHNNYNVFWFNDCCLTNIDFLKAAKRTGIKKIIVHSHNSKNMRSGIIGIISSILHVLHRKVLHRYATNYWSCGLDASKYFYTKSVINSKQHKIINNGIDIDAYKFNPDIREKYRNELGVNGYYVLGNVGRLHFQKNQKFAVKTLSELKKNMKVKLLLVGAGGDKAKLIELSKKLNVYEDVIFLGARNDIANLLCCMDAFVFPSLFEGLGVASVEAQASGLITYNSINVPLDSKVSSNAMYLPIKDPKLWANQILSDSKKSINRLSANHEVKNSKFDIKREALVVQKYFLSH